MISLRHLDFRPEADIDPSHEQLMMTMDFQFSYVDNWLIAPGAFWVHVPVLASPERLNHRPPLRFFIKVMHCYRLISSRPHLSSALQLS